MTALSSWIAAAALALIIDVACGSPALTQEPSAPVRSVAGPRSPTPFVVGGVRLDLDRLTVAPGAVARRGAVLTGTADHAATGRLVQPMTLRAPLITHPAPVGTVLHRVEFATRTPNGTRAITVWCGDMGMRTVFGTASPTLCIIQDDVLSRAFQQLTARPWLATSDSVSGSAPFRFDRFELEASPTDLLGAMDIRLTVERIRRDSVTLRLTASLNGQDSRVLDVMCPVQDGVASFPFWTHVLRLRIEGDTVRPELVAEGDGAGLAEFGVYP